MKREIKFRAWHNHLKRWINLNGFDIQFKPMINTGLVYGIYEQGNLSTFAHDDVSLMQYTGLKDKNGKEIYEGDIVRYHQFLFDGTEYEEEGQCVVEIKEYGVMATKILHDGIGEYMGYSKQDQKDGKVECYLSSIYGLHEDSFEVIGNIHENPELIKE